jgi:hypothetical protein
MRSYHTKTEFVQVPNINTMIIDSAVSTAGAYQPGENIMATHVSKGTVVLRVWNDQGSLTEQSESFTTIDEMFDLCLHAGTPPLVDRVVVQGEDEHGDIHTLTLAFQTITRRSQ